MPALTAWVVGGVAHEDRDAVVGQPPFQRGDDGKGEAAKTVVSQDADRHGPSAVQALREAVGPVADFLGDARDFGPRFGAEAAAVVERLGRGADRDAC